MENWVIYIVSNYGILEVLKGYAAKVHLFTRQYNQHNLTNMDKCTDFQLAYSGPVIKGWSV